MIKLITKNRYYKILGKEIYKDYIKYSKVVFPEDRWSKFLSISESSCIYYLLEEENKVFVYIPNIEVLLIPKIYKNPDNLYNKILSSETTLSNWKVSLIKELKPSEHRQDYTLNTFKIGNFQYLLDRNISTVVYTSGKYKLINSDFPEDSMDFSLTNNLGDPDAYWKKTYLAFPEKSEVMLSDKPKLQLIEDLIATILNENGRNYQRVNSKS